MIARCYIAIRHPWPVQLPKADAALCIIMALYSNFIGHMSMIGLGDLRPRHSRNCESAATSTSEKFEGIQSLQKGFCRIESMRDPELGSPTQRPIEPQNALRRCLMSNITSLKYDRKRVRLEADVRVALACPPRKYQEIHGSDLTSHLKQKAEMSQSTHHTHTQSHCICIPKLLV